MAAPALIGDFGASATTIHTNAFDEGATMLMAGGVVISGGTNTLNRFEDAELGYLDAVSASDLATATSMRVQFASPVAMFGSSFMSNQVAVTLSVFAADNTLLDSLTVGADGFASTNGIPSGFIGLSETGNVIDHAIFSTALASNGLYIGNLIYQGVSAVPEPQSYGMLLAGLGIMGVLARRRKTS